MGKMSYHKDFLGEPFEDPIKVYVANRLNQIRDRIKTNPIVHQAFVIKDVEGLTLEETLILLCNTLLELNEDLQEKYRNRILHGN